MYYIKKKNSDKIHGPFSDDQLTQLIEQKKLDDSYLISSDGKNWDEKMAHNIFGNRYEIICELGRGGMGVVYKARDLTLKRYCALKVLGENENHQNFQEEAKAMARLKHLHIVTIYETGNHFFSMELVEGITLKQWLETKRPVREYLRIFCQVCEAIEYAHRNSVIHRDIKLENIMVDCNGAKVMDFGLARQLDTKYTIEKTGSIMGTPHYMAPEVISGKKANKQSDIYALGVVLYQMMTGCKPFEQDEVVNLFYAIISLEPCLPSQINPQVNKDLEIVCMQSIQKDPRQRYRNVGELKQEIERILENRPILTRPPSFTKKVRKWISRHPLFFILCAIIFFIFPSMAVGFSYYQWKKNSELEIVKEQREESLVRSHLKIAEANIFVKNYDEAFTSLQKALDIIQGDGFKRLKKHLDPTLFMAQSVLPFYPKKIAENSFPYSWRTIFSPNGKFLAGIVHNGKEFRLLCWNIEKQDGAIPKAFVNEKCKNEPIQFGHDSAGIYYNEEGQITYYDFAQKSKRVLFKAKKLHKMVVSANEEYIALVKKHHDFLKIYSLKTREKLGKQIEGKIGLNFVKREVLFSNDNTMLAAVVRDGVSIWNIAKKQMEMDIFHVGESMGNVAFSPERRYVIYNEGWGMLYVCDLLTKEKMVIRGHNNQILDIKFSNDGRFFATCGADKKIMVWDITFSHLLTIEVPEVPRQVAFDKNKLVTFFVKDNKVVVQHWLWENFLQQTLVAHKNVYELIEHGRKKQQAVHSRVVFPHPICVSPTGRYVVQPFHMHTLLWDNGKFSYLEPLRLSTDLVSWSFSPNERFLAYCLEKKDLRIVDLKTRALYRKFYFAKTRRKSISFSHDNEHMFVAVGRDLNFVHIKTKKVKKLRFRKAPICAEESPNGRWLAVGFEDGHLELWIDNFREGQQTIGFHENVGDMIEKIVWHKSRHIFATVTASGKMSVWHNRQGKWQCQYKFYLPQKIVYVFLSPDAEGRYLAVCTKQKIIVFDSKTNTHREWFTSYFKGGGACFFPNWKNIAIPSITGNPLIFSIPTDVEKYLQKDISKR